MPPPRPSIRFPLSTPLLLACLLLAIAPRGTTAERVLWSPAHDNDRARAAVTDATLDYRQANDLTLAVVRTGTNQNWPGLTLRLTEAARDLSSHAFVEVALRNPGPDTVKVHGRVDNPGADGTRYCVNGDTAVPPRGTARLRIELRRHGTRSKPAPLFGMRGYPVAPPGPEDFVPTRVNQLLLFVTGSDRGTTFEIERVAATGTHVAPTASRNDAEPYLPFIDAFGQYRHRDWPGKVRDLDDLARRRETEARELESAPGPSDRTAYGGWTGGPLLDATGFFRVEKVGDRWWLVDPTGRLFWSHGVDCVRMLDATPVERREAWFADFPGDRPEFQEFVITRAFALKGDYAGTSPRCFSFAGANLRRKYGPDWRATAGELIHRRLRSWGLNTIANWSDLAVARLRRTPYTDAVNTGQTRRIEGSDGYWGKFPDVFDPAFAERLAREAAGKRGGSAGDPWCLGYFSDNEMSWGDETSLAEATLRSPADQPAKSAFRDWLQGRFGNVTALNERWGTRHASWDRLLEDRTVPDRNKARAELAEFYTVLAERYFRIVRESLRDVAPRQLYLGCRFAWVNARAAAAAAKYCDVVSYNLYQRDISSFAFNGGADVPLIVGEFHFGALDRGMFHTGLVPVPSQTERAKAYRTYVEGALRHPQFVGTHWFQWQDEPTTGRVYDEENYQIGLVDIADTPYSETIAALRDVGNRLYRLRFEGKP